MKLWNEILKIKAFFDDFFKPQDTLSTNPEPDWYSLN
jgi:hypothetical protein